MSYYIGEACLNDLMIVGNLYLREYGSTMRYIPDPFRSLEFAVEYPEDVYFSSANFGSNIAGITNQEAFLQEFGRDAVLIESVNHGHMEQVYIRVKDMTAEMLEFFNRLMEYPVVDDMEYSSKQEECIREAWSDWLKNDIITALERRIEDEEDATVSISFDSEESEEGFYRKFCELLNQNGGGFVEEPSYPEPTMACNGEEKVIPLLTKELLQSLGAEIEYY